MVVVEYDLLGLGNLSLTEPISGVNDGEAGPSAGDDGDAEEEENEEDDVVIPGRGDRSGPVRIDIVESDDEEGAMGGFVTKKRLRDNADWRTDVQSKLLAVYRAMPNTDAMKIYKRDGWPSGKAVTVMQTAMVRLWIAILDTPLAALLMVDNANGQWAREQMRLVWVRMKKIIAQNPGGYPITNAGVKSKIRRMDDRLIRIKETMQIIEDEILLTSGMMELDLEEVLEYLDTMERSLKRELDTRSGEEYDKAKDEPPQEIQRLRGIPSFMRSPDQESVLNEWKQNDSERKQTYVATVQVESPSLKAVRSYKAQVQAMMQQEKARKKQALEQKERERLFREQAQKREMKRRKAAGENVYVSSSSEEDVSTTDDEAPPPVTPQTNNTNDTDQPPGGTGDESTEEEEEEEAESEQQPEPQPESVPQPMDYQEGQPPDDDETEEDEPDDDETEEDEPVDDETQKIVQDADFMSQIAPLFAPPLADVFQRGLEAVRIIAASGETFRRDSWNALFEAFEAARYHEAMGKNAVSLMNFFARAINLFKNQSSQSYDYVEQNKPLLALSGDGPLPINHGF